MKIKLIIITLLLVLTAILVFIACDSKPTKPEYNNVFDPGNPTTSGDPFQLQVTIGNGGVTLIWTVPDIQNLANFKIYRSEQESTGYNAINTIAATNAEYVDQTVENGHNYWYRVAAVDGGGNETGTTNISAININTNPVLVINSGDDYTTTKEVNLTILANTAQQMMLSNASDFSSANWETYATSKNWTLPTGEGEKLVYMKIQYSDGTESPVAADTIAPQPMNPAIIINNDDLNTPTINVDLQLSAIGATEMFISNTSFEKEDLLQQKEIKPIFNKRVIEEEKAITKELEVQSNVKIEQTQNWEPFSDTKNWDLLTGDGAKIVYAKFRNDFEIETEIVFDIILPQPMNPSVTIAGGAQYTSTRNVELLLSVTGSNLEIKLSEDSTFTGISWLTYLSPINFQLSTGAGIKKVYAKFKNDFEIESQLVSDIISPQPMDPFIIISDGDEYTPTVSIDLIIGADGYNLMTKYSEDSTFTGLNWLALNSPTPFQLSYGDGVKKVFAVFKNDFEIESSIINDIITLDTTPPIPVVVVTPDSGITNETTFQFDPMASSDNLAPLAVMLVRFDWENDGNYDTGWQQLSIINNQYSIGGGDKIIRMQIQDGAGWIADTTMQIFVNTRPTALFTAIEDTINYQKYIFDASTSFDFEDSENVQYRWDFDGDGTWDTSFNSGDSIIIYTFPTGGSYLTSLSVRDQNSLSAELSVLIDVVDTLVTDIDGNSYKIVKIGNQYWLAENLQVTHFQNGDSIPNVTDNSTWAGLTTGAYCEYDNNINNVSTYGRLYNWYAVDDIRNISPVGWHVPSDAEWQILFDYLGGISVAGGKMKTTGTTHWNSPNAGATNTSGFSALPGGRRSGNSLDIGDYAWFWSSAQYSNDAAWGYRLNYWNIAAQLSGSDKRDGYSIRCVRD